MRSTHVDLLFSDDSLSLEPRILVQIGVAPVAYVRIQSNSHISLNLLADKRPYRFLQISLFCKIV